MIYGERCRIIIFCVLVLVILCSSGRHDSLVLLAVLGALVDRLSQGTLNNEPNKDMLCKKWFNNMRQV
jgi:hypothetical protein